MAKRKVVCLDFDGLLHSYKSGWKGADVIPDEPVPGAIDWLKRMLADGRFKVEILSSRNSQGGIPAMCDWLLSNGISRDEIEQIDFPHQKGPAHVIVDDRAICFRGEFPTPDEVAMFKPWWKA